MALGVKTGTGVGVGTGVGIGTGVRVRGIRECRSLGGLDMRMGVGAWMKVATSMTTGIGVELTTMPAVQKAPSMCTIASLKPVTA